MTSLQPRGIKINKKRARNANTGTRGFSCGGCSKSYKSYPALYLHIKRKHNGIKPPNTKTLRSIEVPHDTMMAPTGRPHKPMYDIDDVSDNEANLENVHNIFFHLLGERMMVINEFEPKPKLQDVVAKIQENLKDTTDSYLQDIQTMTQEYWTEYRSKHSNSLELDLEEEPKYLDVDQSLKALVWFVLWLGKYYVNSEFLSDLCMIISRVWKVLKETKLSVKDLDNKLVWKKVIKEIASISKSLTFFQDDKELLYDFTEKTCQMIDRLFQGNSSTSD